MSKQSVLQEMVDRAAVELARVAAARPALSSRCERAAGILAKHVVSPRRGLIRAQLHGGELVGYLVRGSGGAVYRVEAKGSWRCSCPDHHGRHRRPSEGWRACKHGLACWGEPVHTYTRADALADGVLADVTQTAREAGFRVPVALTQSVWADVNDLSGRDVVAGQSPEGRLWDLLFVSAHAARRLENRDR